jgi:CspA family cold shock protein
MSTGKLKWYNAAKGFGFIVPDEGGNDVFVHVSAFKDANITKVDQGQAMEFVVAEHKGKPVATQLKIIAEATTEEKPAESNTESA